MSNGNSGKKHIFRMLLDYDDVFVSSLFFVCYGGSIFFPLEKNSKSITQHTQTYLIYATKVAVNMLFTHLSQPLERQTLMYGKT